MDDNFEKTVKFKKKKNRKNILNSILERYRGQHIDQK